MTKIYLLRNSTTWVNNNPDGSKNVRVHYAGAPYDDPENIDKARVFKTAGAAKLSNEFKHWGYTEILEAYISIRLPIDTKDMLGIVSEALRKSDPEGCDDLWSYEPQADAMLNDPDFIQLLA